MSSHFDLRACRDGDSGRKHARFSRESRGGPSSRRGDRIVGDPGGPAGGEPALLRFDGVARVLGGLDARLQYSESGQGRAASNERPDTTATGRRWPPSRAPRPPAAVSVSLHRSMRARAALVQWSRPPPGPSGGASPSSPPDSAAAPSTAMVRAGPVSATGVVTMARPPDAQHRRTHEDERQLVAGGIPGRGGGVGEQHRGVGGQRRTEGRGPQIRPDLHRGKEATERAEREASPGHGVDLQRERHPGAGAESGQDPRTRRSSARSASRCAACSGTVPAARDPSPARPRPAPPR